SITRLERKYSVEGWHSGVTLVAAQMHDANSHVDLHRVVVAQAWIVQRTRASVDSFIARIARPEQRRALAHVRVVAHNRHGARFGVWVLCACRRGHQQSCGRQNDRKDASWKPSAAHASTT